MSKVNKEMGEVVKAAVGEITGVENLEQPLSEVINQFDPAARSGANLIMPMGFDLNTYSVKQSILWTNLIWRIGKDILKNTVFTTPIGRFVQNMDTGGDIQEVFINLKDVIDRNTLSNSDLFTMFPDDIKAAWHRINKQWAIPTSYREAEIRKVVVNWDTLTTYVGTIVANLPNSFEFALHNHFKNMLFDYYDSGMMEAVLIPVGGDLVPILNNIIDDFRTEPNTRYTSYNITTAPPAEPAITICRNTPLLIAFNDVIRTTEFQHALELHFGRQFDTGNSNQDYARNIIMLNRTDFPNTRSADFVPNPLYSNAPRQTGRIEGFLLDTNTIFLYSQFNLMLSFLNVMTLNVQQVLHTDLLMSLSPFSKMTALIQAL